MPFIDVVMDPRSIQKKWYLKFIYDTCGFQRDTDFIIFVAVALIVVYVVKNLYLCFMYSMQYRFTYDNRRKVATRMLAAYLKQPYSYHRCLLYTSLEDHPFAKEAYEAGKYAFVSDYVRVYVIYHYGGIYFDTDIEVRCV